MSASHPSSSARRSFLKHVGVAGLTPFLAPFAHSAPTNLEATVVKNRAPLAPAAFYSLPLGAIQPLGWLRNQLRLQAAGLGGHLDETWADVGPNSGWLGGLVSRGSAALIFWTACCHWLIS